METRRTLLTAIGSTAAVALAGCSRSSDGDSNSNSGDNSETEADEWTEVDLGQQVEYNFPEGERITYDSKPPAQVQDLGTYVRGQVLEIRGTVTVSEQIRRVVDIQAEFRQGEEVIGQPNTTLTKPGPEEDHPFEVEIRSTEVDSVDNVVLYVEGPEPQT